MCARRSAWLGCVVVALSGCRKSENSLESRQHHPQRLAPALAAGVPALPMRSSRTPFVRDMVGSAIGTNHPTLLLHAANNGEWVEYCQARRDTNGDGKVEVELGHHGDVGGDAVQPYLTLGSGAGLAIDFALDVSPDERFVAVIVDNKLAVVDTLANQIETFADADVRGDQIRGPHRAATFSGDGALLLYFRGDQVVVVDLLKRTERVVTLPKGNAWRMEPNPVGPWVKVAYIARDTDGDGSLTWPSEGSTAPIGKACTGPALSYTMMGGAGDAPDFVWLRADTGELHLVTDFLLPIDDALVTREANKLVIDHVAVPMPCDGKLLSVLDSGHSLLVACTPADAKASVKLLVNGRTVDVPGEIDVPEREQPQISKAPIVCLEAATCVWSATGKKFTVDGEVVLAQPDLVVVARGNEYRTIHRDGHIEAPMLVDGHIRARNGDSLVIGTTIVDMRTGKLRQLRGQALFVSEQGHALLPAAGDGEIEIVTGPLSWD
jgi:hypothetical protein